MTIKETLEIIRLSRETEAKGLDPADDPEIRARLGLGANEPRTEKSPTVRPIREIIRELKKKRDAQK